LREEESKSDKRGPVVSEARKGEGAAAAGSAGLGCASAGPLVRWASPAVVERGEKQASAPSTIGPPGKEGKLFYFFFFFLFFICLFSNYFKSNFPEPNQNKINPHHKIK
jgi:hypothetical protein